MTYVHPPPAEEDEPAIAAYNRSLLLALFLNPWFVAENVRQCVAQLGAVARGGEPARAPVDLVFPSVGRWLVFGGLDPETSHSWGLLGQRFAYDLVAPDGDEVRGRPILAPIAGTVVRARDGAPDGTFEWHTRGIMGNHVVIRSDDGLFCVLAHLQQGSVAVAPGQRLGVGDAVGCCGSSGHAAGPHLHLQLMLDAHPLGARGVPARLVGCLIERAVSGRPYPATGDLVLADADAPSEPPLPPVASPTGAAELQIALGGLATALVPMVSAMVLLAVLLRIAWRVAGG